MPRIQFMNTQIDNVTMQQAIARIEELIQQRKNAYVVTPNVDHIVKLESDETFRKIYENADLILTDGQPLVWFSRWYKTPIVEKVSGSDLFPKLCECAAQKGYTMFFLGAAPGVAAQAAENLKKRYPGLNVVGIYSPPRGFEHDKEELQKTIQVVKDAHPDIMVVGLGAPKQEKFMYEHRVELGVPVSLGLGASFDFEAGTVKRAPRWMRNAGLEWMYRLIKEPRRMFKRYIVDDIEILWLVIKYRPHKKVGK